MADQYSRTRLLLGQDGIEKLRNARIALFGLGGVGGYAAEALARAGVGHMDLIDDDTISLTNLNRQILATHSSIGKYKVDVAADRIRDIDPSIEVRTFQTFYLPDTAALFDFSQYDYVLDAIDTVTGKLMLIAQAKEAGTPVISCMGTGNKLDPTMFEVADIFSTSVCPLCRVMRRELRKIGVDALKVVYSKEPSLEPIRAPINSSEKRTPGSVSFVPSVAGLIITSEVVKDLIAN